MVQPALIWATDHLIIMLGAFLGRNLSGWIYWLLTNNTMALICATFEEDKALDKDGNVGVLQGQLQI